MKRMYLILFTLLSLLSFFIIYFIYFNDTTNVKRVTGANTIDEVGDVESNIFSSYPFQKGYMINKEDFIVFDRDTEEFFILKAAEELNDDDRRYIEEYIIPLFTFYDEVKVESKHVMVTQNVNIQATSFQYFYKVIFSNKEQEPYLSFYLDKDIYINTFQNGYVKLLNY